MNVIPESLLLEAPKAKYLRTILSDLMAKNVSNILQKEIYVPNYNKVGK